MMTWSHRNVVCNSFRLLSYHMEKACSGLDLGKGFCYHWLSSVADGTIFKYYDWRLHQISRTYICDVKTRRVEPGF